MSHSKIRTSAHEASSLQLEDMGDHWLSPGGALVGSRAASATTDACGSVVSPGAALGLSERLAVAMGKAPQVTWPTDGTPPPAGDTEPARQEVQDEEVQDDERGLKDPSPEASSSSDEE